MTDPSPPATRSLPARAATPDGAVTVRGLGPALKGRLRVRAAHNGRSMEAEARAILAAALAAPEEDPADLAAFARALFAPLGGVDLAPPPPGPVREPPDPGAGTFGGGQPMAAEADPPPGPPDGPRAPARKGTAGKKAGSIRRPAPPSAKRRR